MTRLFPTFLSTAAVCVVLSVTPAFAQVAGNPGDQHTQTLYMQQYKGLRGYTARAPEPTKAPEPVNNCGLFHDFNSSASHYQYISVCPLFH
jgi:hypothetical protein